MVHRAISLEVISSLVGFGDFGRTDQQSLEQNFAVSRLSTLGLNMDPQVLHARGSTIIFFLGPVAVL
jgi:hypothetical protein